MAKKRVTESVVPFLINSNLGYMLVLRAFLANYGEIIMTKQDKRKNNKRPFKWGAQKKRHYVNLTDTAWAFYQKMGGNDWVEATARLIKK